MNKQANVSDSHERRSMNEETGKTGLRAVAQGGRFRACFLLLSLKAPLNNYLVESGLKKKVDHLLNSPSKRPLRFFSVFICLGG